MKSRILSCFLIFALCISTLSACGSDTAPSDHSPSSSLQVEISDLQDSTPGETEERDGFESLDSASCKGDTVPSQSDAPSASQGQQTESSAPTEITTASSFSLSDVPAYCGKAYISVNGNVPYFTAAELTTTSFETYSDLDTLGRCGVTYACIGQDLMPTNERGSIGMVKPTGWHTVRYDDLVDGKYLYNRCHLIGFQLTGENANTKNLITGTRYLNIEGMLPFENMVADYVKENPYIYLSVKGENMVFQITACFITDIDFDYIAPDPTGEELTDFFEQVARKNWLEFDGVTFGEEDTVLTLSTCCRKYDEYNTGNQRLVLMAKLLPEGAIAQDFTVRLAPEPEMP